MIGISEKASEIDTTSALADTATPDGAVVSTAPDYNPMACYCVTDYCLGGLGGENATVSTH